MIYAFDFDGTLDDYYVQKFCTKLMRSGHEVWVVTMRNDNDFNWVVMKPVLDKIKLSKSSVIFCNEKPKADFSQAINADVYIDNIDDEFDEIKSKTTAIPLLWN